MRVRLIENASVVDFINELRRMLNDGIYNTAVRQAAIDATASTGVGNDLGIFRYIKAHFTYVPDPYERELVMAPRLMIEAIETDGVTHGDCDDVSLLAAAMYGSIGSESKIVLCDEHYDGVIDHAIACVRDASGNWLDADLSGNVPLGWVSSYTNRVDICP
jgi:hypothetical protein